MPAEPACCPEFAVRGSGSCEGDEPDTFRPDRWADGEPVPFSYVPFGGGYRKCIGFALATFAPHGGVPMTVV